MVRGRAITEDQARNKKVASAFKEAQLIEKYGSGIKRIMEGFANYGLKRPVFENFHHRFRVVVYAQVAETAGETLKGNSALVFSHIKDNPHITRKELAQKTNLSVRGIEYQLAKLRRAKLIERTGSTKSGYWKTLE